MKTLWLAPLTTCAVLLTSCASAPKELVSAREAYRQASVGPAAQVAPAQLHVAYLALARAEQSFGESPNSYQTLDLSYVAQRKAELAEATASMVSEQRSQQQANSDYQAEQVKIVAETRLDLNQARADLAESERSGDLSREDLSATRTDLAKAQRSDVMTKQTLQETRENLQAAEHSGEMSAERLQVEQEARAAAELRATDALAALAKLASVKEDPRGVVITLSGSVLFASNRSVLLPEARARLDQVSEVLLASRERTLTVEGHTDSQGDEIHNLELSQGRANAVRNYLVSKGYQAALIRAQGLGEGHPVADNANAEGRANNRRVEIVIPRGQQSSQR